MENIITYNELQKCPYHSQHKYANQYHSDREDANTGDWDEERDDARTDKKEGYNTDKNDNTGGAGSSGSAATNS
ncbi:hypothetical protein AB9T88_15525 [Flavobacterium sp. LBUM151]|jgi:hypothetical protein